MDFLNQIYDKLTALTDKIPSFSVGGWFIAIIIALVAAFLVIALLTLANKAFRLKAASKKIVKYTNGLGGDFITADNVEDFEKKCIEKAPKSLKGAWAAFSEIRFGFPSDCVNEEVCYVKPRVEYCREFGVSLFNALTIVFTSLFFIFGMAVSDIATVLENALYLIIAGAILSFVLILIGRLNTNASLKAFHAAQDALDAKVLLQNFKTVEPAESFLDKVADAIDEVVAECVAAYPEIDPGEEEEAEEAAVEAEDTAEEEAEQAEEASEEEAEEIDEFPEVERAPAVEEPMEGVYDDEFEDAGEGPIVMDEPDGNDFFQIADNAETEASAVVSAENNEAASKTTIDTASDTQDKKVEKDLEADAETSKPADIVPPAPKEEPVTPVKSEPKAEKPAEAVAPAEEKPPKYIKLKAFFPIIRASNCKRSTYVAITKVLIGAYAAATDPRDKEILKDGLKTMVYVLTKK